MYKKSNIHYKTYNIISSSPYNNIKCYPNYSGITSKKKYSKRNPHITIYNQKRNSYKHHSYSNYNWNINEKGNNLNNLQKKNYKYPICSNLNIVDYEEEYYQEKPNLYHIHQKKKESIDTGDESTFCLSHKSFNENEISDNNNLENSIKENQNLNLNSESIFFENPKKNSEDNENLLKDNSQIVNDKINENIIKKDDNDNIDLEKLNLNQENLNNINLNVNKKTSNNNKFNKFNIQCNNKLIQYQNPIFENTEILSVNVKISKDKIVVFKLRRYDDLFNTIKLFCEINNIREDLIKPIIIKSLEALNNIYKIYNLHLNQNDINELKFIYNFQKSNPLLKK